MRQSTNALHKRLKKKSVGEALSESAHTAAHVASEAFLVTKLAVLLLSYMGLGWRWTVRLLQMIAFVALLMPAFLKVLVWYVTTDTVYRNVAYGKYVSLCWVNQRRGATF